MYSCVFWFKISDLVIFWLLLFDPCHSLHNTEKQPAVRIGGCGPKTHRIADFFDQRQTSIIATPQQTFKSDAFRWNISSSHVQNTFCLRTL